MTAMTNYLEAQLINHVFRTSSYSKPGALAIALSTSAALDDSVTGASMSEVANSNNYSRVLVSPGDANWAAPVGNNGTTSNVSAITFPQASGSWGTVQSVVVTDSQTYGAGNALFYGVLQVAKAVTSGDTFSFTGSALSVQIDNS
jgi:hypothetical protein